MQTIICIIGSPGGPQPEGLRRGPLAIPAWEARSSQRQPGRRDGRRCPGPAVPDEDVTVLGGPPGAARATGGITLGLEEEFVLLDPSTGAAVLAGPVLARMLDGEPGVQQEVMRFQVETATRVCTSLDDLGRELIRLRRLAAGAAASAGCLLVASGIAPYRTPGLAALTNQPRYQEPRGSSARWWPGRAAPAAATYTSGFPPATSASRY